MKLKCGTDIVEVARIEKIIKELGSSFLERIYTKKEIEYCENKNVTKYQSYAARFCGKEAVIKALDDNIITDNTYDISFKDIEILNKKNGRPYANIHTNKIKNIEYIDISLSHVKEYSIANVVIQFKD